MDIEKIDRLNIVIEPTDLKCITISGGVYSASINLEMLDGKILDLKFTDGTKQLKSFFEHLNYAVKAMDWNLSYPGAYVRMGQSDVKTFEEIEAENAPIDEDTPF